MKFFELPNGSQVVCCPDCGGCVVLVTLEDGSTMPVQPTIVRGYSAECLKSDVVNDDGPPDADALIRVLSGEERVTISEPVFIAHWMVCPSMPLVRTLPMAESLRVLSEEEPHAPVVHDLEIQSGKIGQSVKIKSDDTN